MKRRREIGELLRYGKPVRGEGFLLKWLPAKEFGFIVVVGRRYGTAVRRNRLKRLFREALRLNRHRLKREVRVAVLPAIAEAVPRFDTLNAEFGRIFEAITSR